MIKRILRRLRGGQGGFGLLEMSVTLAITGLIGLGAAAVTAQMMTHGARNGDYNTASQYAMNAIYWITRDAQMSQALEPEGASGFPVTLGWTEWDNTEHEVVYEIEDGKMMRSHSVDGGAAQEMLVAELINPAADSTNCTFADRRLIVQVTSTIGEGNNALSVTKLREVAPRPGL